jgi:DNA-binding NarL/FixJ family response regulator
LTTREIEVLRRLQQGLSSKQIAQTLGLSDRTVRKHRENLMRKLGMHSVAQLLAGGARLSWKD